MTRRAGFVSMLVVMLIAASFSFHCTSIMPACDERPTAVGSGAARA